MDERVLRFGLLGTARINRMLIPPLRVSSCCRLLAVASRDTTRAAAYAREWGIERAYGSYRDLLADPDVDVVYVPLPNHLHAQWTIEALRAGKHVLCEKPLALAVSEVDAIADAARASSGVVSEGFMYRHHPQTLRVRELVASGAIGDVRFVRGTFSFPLNRENDVRLRPEWGGGCLWDVGCYPVSFARFVLGAEPTEVFGSWTLGRNGVDETFAGQLVFPGGVLAQIDAGFRSPVRAEIEVAGTDGSVHLRNPWRPSPADPIRVVSGRTTRIVETPSSDRYQLEIEDIAGAILARRGPRISLAESRGNVATLAALVESARSGWPVRVPRPA